MNTLTKIGIIQNAPLPADLSGNLRHIVQGYRECIDHGAQLVVAPAAALSGSNLHDIMVRPSFVRQQMSAMETLSRELGDIPLLLGGYAPLFESSCDDWGDGEIDEFYEGSDEYSANGGKLSVSLVPYLLENNCVSELAEGEVNDILDMQVYIDTTDEEMYPQGLDFDLMIHLGTMPWNAESAEKDARERTWEAMNNGVPVVSVHHVGTMEENLFGGGSGVYLPDKRTLLRLPFFEESAKVANLQGKTRAKGLPEGVELLGMALCRGIRDTVENNGYQGICLSLDHPNSALLAVLGVHAMGASKVLGVTFAGNTGLAESLGIACHSVDLPSVLAPAAAAIGRCDNTDTLALRLQGGILSTLAENKGFMLLTPLDRRRLMTGDFTLYGETCGFLAPLGNLYEMDIYMLSKHYAERHADVFGALVEPAAPEKDRIIHELADLNNSPSALLNRSGYLFKENDVRSIQRRIIASALKRSQFPLILHVDKQEERLTFPLHHRLND